jgi:tetratricopeptide (TPR) repeat protein/transcriptional regulator with XRE-family HTH domain
VGEQRVSFAGLLRQLRTDARLTQEELAEASGVRPRSISDLERGVAVTPQRETVRMLADALNLTGADRAQFEAAARGRAVPDGTGRAAAATRTLPRDISSFTGRRQQLRELTDEALGSGGVFGIHAIGGMAGVGKTAFAVHIAHQLAAQFPAGQIFLPLHGHTPGQQPVDPGDALASLLLALGVPAGQIPAGAEARMALWRDRVAGQQLLLVLDDAASSEQVRSLLPGTSGSLVLITSRRHLSALEDATAISLDTLPPGEAAALLVRLAGRPGLDPADPAVGEITRLCGCLPLAIGMAGRQLHHHPSWSLAGRAAELAAARDRLELMATENVSVAAAFNLSYEDLTGDQRRLFRRLGLHLGTDLDAYAAAALDGTDLATARRGLEALYDLSLLTEPAQGRYRLHDLIREHARALAARLDPDGDRDQATARLLDYYQHTANRANTLLARQTTLAPAFAADWRPAEVPALADREQALAWARAERANLLGCLDHATGTGQHAHVIALTAGLVGLLRNDGPWTEAVARHATALRAAQQLGDRPAQAGALNNLGMARRQSDDYPHAVRCLEESLVIYRDLGDRLGQANVLGNLGDVRGATGDYPGAARALEEALSISRALGDQLGQAHALNYLGMVRELTGDLPGAAQALQEALSVSRSIGDQLGTAHALNDLGAVRRMSGDFPGAAQAHAAALDIFRAIGYQLGQANALTFLGMVRRMSGDYPGAAQALEESLDISRAIGYQLGQANALQQLGDLRRMTGDLAGAALALEEALDISGATGYPLGQANALNDLGTLRRMSGDYPGAAQALEEALGIYRDLGDRLGQAYALNGLGALRRMSGDYPGAAQALEEALSIFRDIGNRDGEVEALNLEGTLRRVRGDLSRAWACHWQALDLAREIGSSLDEAKALAGLSRCALAGGLGAEAADQLERALEIFLRIGAAEATELAAELDAMRAAAHRPPDASAD